MSTSLSQKRSRRKLGGMTSPVQINRAGVAA